jgi:hypothetical protein
MEVGVPGVSGAHAPKRVVLEAKSKREVAIIPLLVMEAETAVDIPNKLISATQ